MPSMTIKKKPGRRKSPDSKRSLGADRHAHPRKSFHAPQELFAALEAYILATKPQPTDAAVLRLSLERFLEQEGFWPQREK